VSRRDPDSYDAEAGVCSDPLLAELWLGFGGDADDCRRCGGPIAAGVAGALCSPCARATDAPAVPRDRCGGWWRGPGGAEHVACAARALAPQGLTRCNACDVAQVAHDKRSARDAQRAERARIAGALAKQDAAGQPRTNVATCMAKDCDADTGAAEKLHCAKHDQARRSMLAGPGEAACALCGRALIEHGRQLIHPSSRGRRKCAHCTKGAKDQRVRGPGPDDALLRFARSFLTGGETA
jgi:hypothetical protein